MGEEKAPKGGDAEPPQPVVLRMELHCAGCAQKVKKSIKHLPGVESVVADAAANRVVVAGTADAAALKARIEAKTKRAVEIVSAGSGGPKKAAAESKADKGGGAGGGENKKADKDGASEKKGDKDAQPKEEKEQKQPPEEKKPKEETVLLKIRLHCDGCADRIRRRIYKIKGVKDVVLDSNGKDEVRVTGTMDVAAMLVYLKEKLNRTVEAVAPGKKDGGEEKKYVDKKDKGGDGDKKKDAAAAGGDDKKGTGKGIEAAGPSKAAAAASMAPPPAEASTYHVSPYGYVAYPQGPPASYYHYYGGNADGAAHANPNGATDYPHHPNATTDYPHHPNANANANANPNPNHQPYPPYPYGFDMAPAPQLFSDENPNACSVM